jgi:hypothetical protein
LKEERAVETVGHPAKGDIWLKVNGELKQRGDLPSRAPSPLSPAISSTAELSLA